MRGPYHEFVAVAEREHPRAAYLSLLHSPEAVRVADDLVRYIGDTLDWVPSSNPAGGESRQTGLNYFGPTIIDPPATAQLARIIRSWIAIFRLGPERLQLRGWWSETDQAYERLEFERAALIAVLEQLEAMTERVGPGEYLVHLGI